MDLGIYKVFIKTDDQGRITDINSSAFLKNTDGWVQFAEGIGDQFHHAQRNFLAAPIFDDRGIANYIYKDGQIKRRDEQDKDDEAAQRPHIPTHEERIKVIEEIVDNLTKVLKAFNILK